MKKSALIIILAVLILTGCNTTESLPAEIPSIPEISHENFVLARMGNENLNPLMVQNNTNKLMLKIAYDGLIKVNAAFEPEKILASEYMQEGNTFTFTINPNAKFWDGSAVSAADVAYSYNQARNQQSPYVARFNFIQDCYEKDGRVIIRMSNSSPYNINLCDIPIIKRYTEQNNLFPVGSGKYELIQNGGELFLQANTSWINAGTFEIKKILIENVIDMETLNYSFNAGTIKAIYLDNFSKKATLKGDNSYCDFDTTFLSFLGFNFSKDYFQDENIRNALSRSIDRVKMTSDVLINKAVPAWTLFNPVWAEMKRIDIPKDIHSSEAAANKLLECGFTRTQTNMLAFNGRDIELKLIVENNNTFKISAANAAANNLRMLGFTVTVHELSLNEYTNALNIRDFDLYFGEVKLSENMDVSALGVFEINRGGFDAEMINAPLYALYNGGSLADTIMAISEKQPLIPLYYRKDSVAVMRKLSNELQPLQGDIFNGIQNCRIN